MVIRLPNIVSWKSSSYKRFGTSEGLETKALVWKGMISFQSQTRGVEGDNDHRPDNGSAALAGRLSFTLAVYFPFRSLPNVARIQFLQMNHLQFRRLSTT